MALAADRNTPRGEGNVASLPVAGSTKIYAGALVATTAAGYAKGATGAANLFCVGRAEEQVDNSAGADGDLLVKVRQGIFRWDNATSGDALTKADIGGICYALDDHTVARTDNSGARSRAGIVVAVDDAGVWVDMRPDRARVGTVNLAIRVATLVGTGVYYAVSPVAGRITAIRSITEGVLTTGDATLTSKINGTGVTGGVITITQSGSAAGDVDLAVPTAANAVTVGDKISLTVGGSNATATVANCLVEITL